MRHTFGNGVIVQIYRNGSSTSRAPESTFAGDVQIGGYFRRAAPSRLVGASASFAPGSRTPWKVNPVGQTLVVTSGTGWAQIEGEEVVEIHAGDFIWCPPGQPHWEGATPTEAMAYVALQEEGGGGGVQFRTRVTDAEYLAGPAGRTPATAPR